MCDKESIQSTIVLIEEHRRDASPTRSSDKKLDDLDVQNTLLRNEITRLEQRIIALKTYPCVACGAKNNELRRCYNCKKMTCSNCQCNEECSKCKLSFCVQCAGWCVCGGLCCKNCGDFCFWCGETRCGKCTTDSEEDEVEFKKCPDCRHVTCTRCQFSHGCGEHDEE